MIKSASFFIFYVISKKIKYIYRNKLKNRKS